MRHSIGGAVRTLGRSARLMCATLALGLCFATAAVAHADDPSTDVSMTMYSYVPQVVTVAPGTTVTWTNADAVPHTVTWDDASVDSGLIDGGGTFSYTSTEPGTYGYYCVPHGTPGKGMYGTVIVSDDAG